MQYPFEDHGFLNLFIVTHFWDYKLLEILNFQQALNDDNADGPGTTLRVVKGVGYSSRWQWEQCVRTGEQNRELI